MHSLTPDHDERVRRIALGDVAVIQHCRTKSRPWKWQSMESTENYEAGFPPYVEIPSGFQHSHGVDDWVYIFSCPLNSNQSRRMGLVTDVSRSTA
jgi:hypothetical protein